MGDRNEGRTPQGSPDDHNRTGVFRRDPDGGMPDQIERMYRKRHGDRRRRREERSTGEETSATRRMPAAGETSATRRMPAAEERPRSSGRTSGGRGRGRVYDGTGQSRQRREMRRRRGRTIAVLALVILVILPAGFYFWADSRLRRVDALTDYEGRPGEQPGDTYMIVGSDSREGLTEEDRQELRTGDAQGKRTDTIMVLYVPDNGSPSIISVPRDSLVQIPEIGENKINAAFASALGGGPGKLVRTFEQESGVRIDHYVEVGFAGFVDIVNAVGGVELCPEEPMKDPKAGLDIPAGCQTLDGETALGYVRTRASARADLDRIQRQREFFSVLVSEATSPGTLLNPFRVVPLVMEGTDTFEVDEGDHLSDLAGMALAMRENPTTTAIPISSTPTLAGVGSVVLWDEERSGQMFEAMRNGQQIPESALQE
ncbi:LCP family protein [Salinactinospora qingdaonensis]|uniref:Cell envelope-related transcriptional attenuator domain-containing protein n=1 Tax=Salinactinospora qingdaonensis TaxID=702744 RepID=A0ABP7GK73_9ACTN